MDHSFVIPAYGRSAHLKSCVESILSQTLKGSSVSIATSTPSDFLRDLAEHYQVGFLVNPARVDIATDWNFALQSSSSRFVTIAHQDDLYEPAYLQCMSELIAKHPRCLLAFSDYVERTDHGPRPANMNLRVKRWLCSRSFADGEVIATTSAKVRLLNLGNPICCPSVILNKERVPTFRFSSSLKTNLDWDAWTRLADEEGEFLYSRHPLVSKRVHADSETTVTIANRIREKEDREMFARFWPRPVAAAVATVYKLGYWSNRT